MSRSGYSDDYGDDDPLAMGRWRQAVQRAMDGKRGQAFLRDLLATLDAMPDKRLYAGSFATEDGEFCTLGAHAARKGVRVDDLGNSEDCDTERVGERFGIARSMAAEIMYMNDEWLVDQWTSIEVEICGPIRPFESRIRHAWVPNPRQAEKRWQLVREWVVESLKSPPAAGDAPK